MVIRVTTEILWECIQGKGGNWVAACEPLKLTVQSPTWAELMEDIADTLNATFKDLLATHRIGKCLRCEEVFVTPGRWKKIYCSHKCASACTAEKAVRARRERERKAHVATVRQAAEEFSKLSPKRRARLNQRDWIHGQTGLSKKLVTMILRKEGL